MATADSCSSVRLFDVTPDGRNAVWASRSSCDSTRRGQVWFDNRLIDVSDSVVLLQFTNNHLYFLGTLAERKCRLRFGQSDVTLDRILWRSITPNSDGSRIAYAGGNDRAWFVLTADSVKVLTGKSYARVGAPVFCADGRLVAHSAMSVSGNGKEEWFAVWANKELRHWFCDYLGGVKPSPIGAGVAYIVVQDDKAFVVNRERADARYDDVGWLEYLPKIGLVYAAMKAGRWFIVRDGYPLRERYDEISYPVGSATGALSFVARQGRQFFVTNGRNQGPSFDWIILPQFSPDGRHLGYSARQGNKWLMVRDGKPNKAYDEVSWLTWSSDGRNMAYRARSGERYCVVLDGAESPWYDAVCRLQFSADNRRLVFGARDGRRILSGTVRVPGR